MLYQTPRHMQEQLQEQLQEQTHTLRSTPAHKPVQKAVQKPVQTETRKPRHHAPSRGFSLTLSGGFSLIELLIAVALVGILAGIAYPAYTSHVQRAHRAEARAVLLEAAQYMERYYSANTSYASASLPDRLSHSPAGSTAADARYTLAVTADATSFTLTATPTKADGCGALTINQVGARGAPSPESGITVESCWR